MAERPCTAPQNSVSCGIRIGGSDGAAALHCNTFVVVAGGNFCAGWSVHRHRGSAGGFGGRRDDASRTARHGVWNHGCRERGGRFSFESAGGRIMERIWSGRGVWCVGSIVCSRSDSDFALEVEYLRRITSEAPVIQQVSRLLL